MKMVRLIGSFCLLLVSLLAIWPHLVGLVCLSVICFAASYILFMRQEIRPT